MCTMENWEQRVQSMMASSQDNGYPGGTLSVLHVCTQPELGISLTGSEISLAYAADSALSMAFLKSGSSRSGRLPSRNSWRARACSHTWQSQYGEACRSWY